MCWVSVVDRLVDWDGVFLLMQESSADKLTKITASKMQVQWCVHFDGGTVMWQLAS